MVSRRETNVGRSGLAVHVPLDNLSVRSQASHGSFQPVTCHLVFLSPAEHLFPVVPSSGLQDYLLELLQRGLAASLPDRAQMDVPRSNPAIVISAHLPVCAAGRFQTLIRAGCSRVHAWHVSVVPACLRHLSPDCGLVAHVWV